MGIWDTFAGQSSRSLVLLRHSMVLLLNLSVIRGVGRISRLLGFVPVFDIP